MRVVSFLIVFVAVLLCQQRVIAQQTNPVDRQVANPITDTPNIDPVSAEQTIRPPKPARPTFEPEGGDGELVIYSGSVTAEGEEGKRVIVYLDNVDARYGIYRLQADKITLYEAEDRMEAEGSVVFDQGDDQRITGARGVWNLRTKLGVFEDSTGFTNQTDDGTVIYFIAERVERVSLDEVVITKGKFTACDEAVPKWSFTADEARVKANDRVRLKGAKFRVKDVPIVALPFASIPIKQQDRASGFLTPTVGYSRNKGLRLSGAYYQTLGRSADVTFRGDLYTSRGIGYGLDFRSRANSRSFFNFGFYAVEDRILGKKASPDYPDQGGTMVYADGVHFFPNGFTAAADVRITSNLAFRQVFSDGIQQIISPIEVSQAFVTKSWDSFTLNLLARSQTITIPNVTIKTRNLPSVNFDKRPTMLSFLRPVYFTFRASVEGVSRRERADNAALYFQQTGSEPVVSPAIGQRLDFQPQLILPLSGKYFNVTAAAGGRITYYSNSFNDMRQVVGTSLIRKYGEFELDVRPVALARNYYGSNNSFRFRHVIEPYATYRYITGIKDFRRIIRFDAADTVTDTNEIEFGLMNRIYTRRYAEAVTDEARSKLSAQSGEGQESARTSELTVQPYEIFNLTVRGKYFFDKRFGGALVPGQRNQIAPMTALSFYTFGGVPRRFSPLNIDMTYRPQRTIFVNTRADVGFQGDGLRAVTATIGYDRPLIKLFQTFYYTRAVTLVPTLQQYADERGKEAGTLRGSQWSPSVFLGDRDRGLYGGASVFFDFENRRATKLSPLISSLYTLGYAYDCCSLALQYYSFNVGARNENRFVFSFRLNGIGSFGTEQFGQGIR
ncbi:LPS-assembly protein LptD [Leptolyngbya sp. 7M]|uniref:LPS-assembly protein LptD n=1 Tax=Leptolyngbya sp. 7M TaxID=2812896 RepID=UPI001B8B3243|nr:LPS assembly protein LptD [Leptolyngbya sp. 7M]QYO68042.1 LPS assembly protein LptD [Leptolyngbya sp. 7M]